MLSHMWKKRKWRKRRIGFDRLWVHWLLKGGACIEEKHCFQKRWVVPSLVKSVLLPTHRCFSTEQRWYRSVGWCFLQVKGMTVTVIARLTDMCMGDISFRWWSLGMLSWHVYVTMIFLLSLCCNQRLFPTWSVIGTTLFVIDAFRRWISVGYC